MRIIVALPDWGLSGVNMVNALWAETLAAEGVEVTFLIAQGSGRYALSLPEGVNVENPVVDPKGTLLERWDAMCAYIEDQAPCLFLPGHDFVGSAICPVLSDRVGIIGTIHSDDPLYYEQARLYGDSWDAALTVSGFLREQVLAEGLLPPDKVEAIHNGVAPADPWLDVEEKSLAGLPLRCIYAGRLENHQKRVDDLPEILAAAEQMEVPLELVICGTGEAEESLKQLFTERCPLTPINFLGLLRPKELFWVFEQCHAFLLPTRFEGLPMAMLEAMARGCVPLVNKVRSGIPEAIEDGKNGILIEEGDFAGFARHLSRLNEDREHLARMSRAAMDSLDDKGFTVERMSTRYRNLFERVFEQVKARAGRPRGTRYHPCDLAMGTFVNRMSGWRKLGHRAVRKVRPQMLVHSPLLKRKVKVRS